MRNGIEIIKMFEGCKLEAYLCPAKIWTIGWGATFYEDGSKVKPGDKITQSKADSLLDFHYDLFEKEVKKLLKVPVNENQLGALVSFAFNLGSAALAGSSLLKKINANDFGGAAQEFDKWVFANKVKLNGLVKRRTAEKTLFLKPTVNDLEVANTNTPAKTETPTENGLVKLFKGLFGR